MDNLLDSISQDVKQKIFECISQAIGEDRQEADAHLGLRTHVSGPFLNWDLIYRNLMNSFGNENVKYSATVRGMWTVLLLYDVKSGLLISFMRDTRLDDIKRSKVENQPQYVRSLIALNEELQAPYKQQTLLGMETESSQEESELANILDDLCANFDCHVNHKEVHHALVCFSGKFGVLSSLKAYILDKDLDVVCEQDWLNTVKPVMSNTIETAEQCHDGPALSLKPKATKRLKEKELVALKEQESEKQA